MQYSVKLRAIWCILLSICSDIGRLFLDMAIRLLSNFS